MQVTLLDTARIDRDWGAMEAALASAVAHSPGYNLTELYGALLDGYALAFEVSGDAKGLWIVSLDGDVAWTTAIAGKIEGGPKQRLATIRHAVSSLEAVLSNNGFKTHRICGRDWSAILPEYKPYAGARNGIEKRLA